MASSRGIAASSSGWRGVGVEDGDSPSVASPTAASEDVIHEYRPDMKGIQWLRISERYCSIVQVIVTLSYVNTHT